MSTSSRFAFAVHVLTLMAWVGDEPLKSEAVARSVNTNPVVIRRLLCQLARAKIVTSQTGAGGGSKLARKPNRINLLEVFRAVEDGNLFALHRQPPSQHCPVGMNIETILEDVLEQVSFAVESVLAKITVEDVLQKVGPCVSEKWQKVRR